MQSKKPISVPRIGPSGITFHSLDDHSSVCTWSVPNFLQLKLKSLHSPYFQVGGYDFRFLMYPRGDSVAVPGHISLYLQINFPKTSRLDFFASYKLTIVNSGNMSKSVSRESYYRFSSKRKSIGWSDFAVSSSVVDSGSGFLSNGSLLVKADIRILNESMAVSSADVAGEVPSAMSSVSSSRFAIAPHVSNGKITWTLHNYGLFKDVVKTYKIMSSSFQVGEVNLRMCMHGSVVGGVQYLALTLETAEIDSFCIIDRSSWCLFKVSVLNQKAGLDHVHKDSFGRFGVEHFGGNVSLGWTDYMRMSDFVDPGKGFLVDGNVVFRVSFNAIKESSFSFPTGIGGVPVGRCNGILRKFDEYMGKFMWKIDNFSKLKDLLKKKKKTGLCVKSRRFKVGKQDFRLLLYPRGQSQKPCHLSLFLNILDPKKPSTSSSFVHYRLSVMNQRTKEKSIVMESQNRCSKDTTDWGWLEFMSLASLFDQDSGFLLQDTVVLSAEVHVLKETFLTQTLSGVNNVGSNTRPYLTWKLENFLSFKEVMGTQKLFSSFFQFGGCELRIGIYESLGALFMYLECDPSVEVDPDKNFWVKYRMGVVNQKEPSKTLWMESSIFTSSCSSSDIKISRIEELLEVENGFLIREMVVFACEILDYCPWFEFAGLEFQDQDGDGHVLPNEDQNRCTDCGSNEESNKDNIDIFSDFLLRVFIDEDDPVEQLKFLKVRMNAGVVANILIGLRFYLDDPVEMNYLQSEFANQDSTTLATSSSSLMSLGMLVKVLKQAINHLILDLMVECCLPQKGISVEDSYDGSSKPCPAPDAGDCLAPREICPVELVHSSIFEKLFSEVNNHTSTSAGQCSDVKVIDIPRKQCIHPPETFFENILKCSVHSLKVKWSQPSKELLVLIVDSLKALNGTGSEDCPEPRERPQLVDKIFLLLDKAPKHLLPDIVTLVVKLVNHLEHPLVVSSLFDQLQKHEIESTLQTSVFDAIGQLSLSSEVWKQVLSRVYVYFLDSNEELFEATISLLFKAASHCQHIPQAVKFVRARLESLGANISFCVLDLIRGIIKSWSEIAETMLSQINSVFEMSEKCATDSFGPSYDENEVEATTVYSMDDQLPCADNHFLSVYCLIEMMSVSSMAVEAAQTFERGVAIGLIKDHLVTKVLERQHGFMELCHQEVEFNSVLHLAEILSLSRNSRVHGFVKFFYATLFRLFADERYHKKLLEGLVERALNPAISSHELDLDLLAFLIQGDTVIARLFASMTREAAKLAYVDRETIWNRLCASEDENIQVKEEMQAELKNIKRENASLLERLSESEAAVIRFKSEGRLKEEHFAWEKKELSKQIDTVMNQLEYHVSERGDEIAKFSSEKKVYQDRICALEKELVLLKSQNQKVGKEKNAITQKLRKAEDERESFESKLRQISMKAASEKGVQRSLLDEVSMLKQRVTQTEGEKQEMEKEVARCKAHAMETERTLNNCKQHISSLEVTLREEMLQHAPLYGVGLEYLSLDELETVSRIHEEGLREINALRYRLSIPLSSSTKTSQVPTTTNGTEIHNNTAAASDPLGDYLSTATSSSQHIDEAGLRNSTDFPSNRNHSSTTRPPGFNQVHH